MSQQPKTYIFDQNEVQKTGRIAVKKFTSGKSETVYEITPVNPDVGMWKKWVNDGQLHEVVQ